MFIDIHAHAYRFKPVFGCGFCTAEELIAEYDKLGISMGVVQPIVSPEVYEPQTNEDVLEMAEKYPDRIIPFCNVDPRAGKNSPTTNFTPILQHYKDRGCKGLGEVMKALKAEVFVNGLIKRRHSHQICLRQKVQLIRYKNDLAFYAWILVNLLAVKADASACRAVYTADKA